MYIYFGFSSRGWTKHGTHATIGSSFGAGGIAIRTGSENVSDPDDDTGQRPLKVDFVGSALVVKDRYHPEYQYLEEFGGNHTYRIPVTEDLSFEYLMAGARSQGVVYNTVDEFVAYVRRTAREYNHPVHVEFGKLEQK